MAKKPKIVSGIQLQSLLHSVGYRPQPTRMGKPDVVRNTGHTGYDRKKPGLNNSTPDFRFGETGKSWGIGEALKKHI